MDNYFGKNKNINQLNKSILNKNNRTKTTGTGMSTIIFDEKVLLNSKGENAYDDVENLFIKS